MKSFNEFYISTKRIFWAVNFAFAVLTVLAIGFTFNFDFSEVMIQLGIAISMTFLLVWMLGGYDKIKSRYIERVAKKVK